LRDRFCFARAGRPSGSLPSRLNRSASRRSTTKSRPNFRALSLFAKINWRTRDGDTPSIRATFAVVSGSMFQMLNQAGPFVEQIPHSP
jgi:hypothetical protein